MQRIIKALRIDDDATAIAVALVVAAAMLAMLPDVGGMKSY